MAQGNDESIASLKPKLLDQDREKCRLREQIERVRRLHEDDLANGFGSVWLPTALREKYRHADRELGWQFVFPSSRLSEDPREPN